MRALVHTGGVIYNLVMVKEILRPASVQEALKAGRLPGSAYLGGGTRLNRDARPLTLISLENLGLEGIEMTGGRCVLGAAATFQQLVDDSRLPAVLRKAASLVGSRTLRNMMTVGGEVALHPADSPLVLLLLAMDAQVSLGGEKKPVSFPSLLSAKSAGLVLSVTIPEAARPGAVLAVSRTSHGARSLVLAACAETLRPVVSGLRVAVSDCVGNVMRLARLEQALEGRSLPAREQIEEALGDDFSPAADMHASSRYKLYMARVLAADSLHEMAGEKAGV